MVPRRSARNKDPTIVIGIDFGTTHTGVAWARSGMPDVINIITNWKSSHLYNINDKAKAPSRISYEDDGQVASWGYAVQNNKCSLEWFKLLLIEDDDLPDYVRDTGHMEKARQLRATTSKRVVDIIADYLREVWKHSIANIEKATGKEVVENSVFNVVVTLPAIWPLYAYHGMQEAVKLAGILDTKSAGKTSLTFISEPEAAALATMKDMAYQSKVKSKDQFVVVDAGGGTVDVISYEIVKTEPMTVRESVKGDGKLCGAIFLDDGFRGLLKETIPRKTYTMLGEKGIQKIMNNNWENGIKPQFRNEDMDWEIDVPSVGNQTELSEFKFSREQILEVYQPVTWKIVGLVRAQIGQANKQYKKAPKYIVLVGGFGKSHYLYRHLQETIGNEVEILQGSGERPWTAVCRGAVIKGATQGNLGGALSVTVNSRVARGSYGTSVNIIPWTASDHDAADRVWCPVNRAFLAVDQNQWFLYMNDPMPEGEPIRHRFWLDLNNPGEEIETEIIYSEAELAPSRGTDDVKQLCRIRIPSAPIFERLPSWTNTNEETFRQVQYDVQMTIAGPSIEFAVFFEGEKLASQYVNVDAGHSGTTSD